MNKNNLLSKLFHRYFIVALNGMALGLFCTLIIGLIIKQIAINLSGALSSFLIVVATISMALTGPVIGIGVAHALKAPKLVILASGVVGFLGAFGSNLGTNHLVEQGKLIVTGSGDPLGAFISVVIAAEIGRLVSGKTKIDIIVTPFITIIIGAIVSYFTGPYLIKGMKILGTFIREATELHGDSCISSYGNNFDITYKLCCVVDYFRIIWNSSWCINCRLCSTNGWIRSNKFQS